MTAVTLAQLRAWRGCSAIREAFLAAAAGRASVPLAELLDDERIDRCDRLWLALHALPDAACRALAADWSQPSLPRSTRRAAWERAYYAAQRACARAADFGDDPAARLETIAWVQTGQLEAARRALRAMEATP